MKKLNLYDSVFSFLAQYISDCLSIMMNVSGNNEYNTLFLPEWRIGSCFGPGNIKHTVPKYQPNEVHFIRCCLPPEIHTNMQKYK